MGKALSGVGHCSPRVICTGKEPTYAAAIAALIDKKKLSKAVEHRQVKYLNDMIEGDHGRLERIVGPKSGVFKNPVSVYQTLQGAETLEGLSKCQVRVFVFGFQNPDSSIADKAFADARENKS